MSFQNKLDLVWSRLIGSHTTHIPLSSDPRLYSTLLSTLQCLLFIWFASKVNDDQKSDPYEVFTVLQFFVFLIDFIPLMFAILKTPTISRLYFTRQQQSVPIPLYPSRIINFLPILLHFLKLIYILAFIPPIILSGDIIIRHTLIIIFCYIIYFIVALAGILMRWQRFIHYTDWDMDEDKIPTPFTTLKPFSLSKIPTFSVSNLNISQYFIKKKNNNNDLKNDDDDDINNLESESLLGGRGNNGNGYDDGSSRQGLLDTSPMIIRSSSPLNSPRSNNNNNFDLHKNNHLNSPNNRHRDIVTIDNDYEINLDPIKHSPLLRHDDNNNNHDDEIDVHVQTLDFSSILTKPSLESSSIVQSSRDMVYSPPNLSIGTQSSPLLDADEELP